MSDRFLLDTDAIIDLLRGFPSTLAIVEDIVENDGELCICDIGIAEIFAGLDPRDEPLAYAIFDVLTHLPTTPAIAERAGRWRYTLRGRGLTIHTPDAFVAATAHAHGAAVVTGNVKDYPMSEIGVVTLPR